MNHFEELGLKLTANESEIIGAYRDLRRRFDADPARLANIEQAYAVLCHPVRRRAYLELLRKGQVGLTTEQSGPKPAMNRGSGQKPATDTPAADPAGIRQTPVIPASSESPTGRTGSTQATKSVRVPTQLGNAPTPSKPETKGEDVYATAKGPPAMPVPPPAGGSGSVRRHTEIGAAPPARTSGRAAAAPVADSSEPKKAAPLRSGSQSGVIQPRQPAKQGMANTGAPQSTGTTGVARRGGHVKRSSTVVDTSSGARPYKQEREKVSEEGTVVRVPATEPSASNAGISRVAMPIPRGQVKPPYVVVEFDGSERVYQLKPGENYIGRPSNEATDYLAVPLDGDNRYVSRRHAIVLIRTNSCEFTDVSGNGTVLDNENLPKDKSVRIRNGAVAIIEQRKLRFVLEA